MSFSWKIFAGWAALLLLAVSLGALEWKTTALSIASAPFQTELDAVFEFTNQSSNPVEIREIETSCSCLLGQPDKKIYPPGSVGKITAHFTVGDRGGVYERSLTVLTDEPGEPVRLMLKVEIPPVASAFPRSLEWRLGESPAEKTIDLKPERELQIVFSEAQPTNDTYSTRLETVVAGRHYRLHVTPVSTDAPVSAAIRITGREKTGHAVGLSAYVSIK